jgi:hypothetical protein
MEPRNDSDLRELLREWQAPELPASLEERVLGRRENWWHFLVRGYIRVPVPVACCLAVILIAAGWRLSKAAPMGTCSAAFISIDHQKSGPVDGKPVRAASTNKGTTGTTCLAGSSC